MRGDEAVLARRLRIEGRVQGVGFRWALCAKAQALDLSGWVRNRSDGSVEALARGSPEALDALTIWAWQGPPGARVLRVLISDDPGSDCGDGFTQRASV